jgi:hypothetical protein
MVTAQIITKYVRMAALFNLNLTVQKFEDKEIYSVYIYSKSILCNI